MLSRFNRYLGKDPLPAASADSPSDIELVPDYAKDAVTEFYRAGIIKGRPGGVFDPDATITRAEAAALFERYIKNQEVDQ